VGLLFFAFVFIAPPEFLLCLSRRKKALRRMPLISGKPNAGLVSLYDGLLELFSCGRAGRTVLL